MFAAPPPPGDAGDAMNKDSAPGLHLVRDQAAHLGEVGQEVFCWGGTYLSRCPFLIRPPMKYKAKL